jgi:hypothetical protein
MSGVQTKLASAVFIGVLATLPMSTVFDGAARAADDCLAEPNGQAPQGKHWYYRIERGTGRHCWYVRGEDESARAAASDSTATAKTPPRNADLMAPRSIANARAEWPAQQPATSQSDTAPVPPRVAPPATGVTGTAPSTTPTQAPASGAWPDPARAMRPLGAPPETTAVAADQQADVATVPLPASVPPPPGLAAMATDRNTGSLQKLLLVAFGALVLSGLTGSAVYRLASARRRARMRRDRWPKRKFQQIASNVAMTPWAPPEIENAAPRRDSVHKRAEMDNVRMDNVEMDDVRMDNVEMDDIEMDNVRMDNVEIDDIEMDNVRMGSVEMDDPEMDDLKTDDVETDAPDHHVERIEDFLARFTRKLEAEMAVPRQQPRRAVS